ncbi:MAG: hypothetical protein PHQ12_03440 [Chthoniobacteraceae bacterium]|nr:hypothetical protein [Chthoniobacteraceae bacterium]
MNIKFADIAADEKTFHCLSPVKGIRSGSLSGWTIPQLLCGIGRITLRGQRPLGAKGTEKKPMWRNGRRIGPKIQGTAIFRISKRCFLHAENPVIARMVGILSLESRADRDVDKRSGK